MRTKSGSTHNPHLGLYVGLELTLSASLAAQAAGLWLALRTPAPGDARMLALGLIAGSLACLASARFIVAALLRERGQGGTTAGEPVAEERAVALAHAQKMEALGLLAGGVAHDFNNLLHVIRNSLEILQREGPQADSRRYLEMIRRSADRATALTQQLLVFSRRQPPEPRPLDANDLIVQVSELLRHALGERITIQTVLGREVATVAADAGQLEAALLNLAVNARDAMSQAGLLTIETANAPPESAGGARRAERYVMIAVSDTGSGMAPAVAARACEPFFTTKEPGHGTGLGLSQVAGFARQSGGYLRISSVPGRGTTVRLYLPRSGPFAEPLPRAPPPPEQRLTEKGYCTSAVREARRSWPVSGC
ncbi:MAG TPA: ATP-binding protein [Steroidobacteraceae bacterium]|nr:ATP-binding protein [Steroidobacteraceae bacterium]